MKKYKIHKIRFSFSLKNVILLARIERSEKGMPTKKNTETKKATTKKTSTTAKKTTKPKNVKKVEEIQQTEMKVEEPVIKEIELLKEEKKESYIGLKLMMFVLILLLIALGAYSIYDSIFAKKDEEPNNPVCTESNTKTDNGFSIEKYVKDSVIDNNKVVFDYICTIGKDCNKELIQTVIDDEETTFDLQYKSQTTNEINAGQLKIEANKKVIISEDIIGGAHIEYFKTYLNHYFVVAKTYSDNRMVTKIYDKEGRMMTEIDALKGNFYGLEGVNFYQDKIIYFANDAVYDHVAMHTINIKDGLLEKETKVETDLDLK